MENYTTKKWENSKIRDFAHYARNYGFFTFFHFFGVWLIIWFFLKFFRLIFRWETTFSLDILYPNPISSALFRDYTLETYSGRIRGTLKLQLLKKLSLKHFKFFDFILTEYVTKTGCRSYARLLFSLWTTAQNHCGMNYNLYDTVFLLKSPDLR